MLAPAMNHLRVGLLVPLVLVAASPASAEFGRDTAYVEMGLVGIGPGIPVEGQGIGLGGTIDVLFQEDESDWVLYLRPGLLYYRTLDGWGDDARTFDMAGASMSVGFGIADLEIAVPYVELGIDPVGAWSLEPIEIWDWAVGIHGSIGALFKLGDMFTLRPAVGFGSFLFTDIAKPIGGLWFTVAFGIDTDPPEDDGDGYGYDEPEGFSIQGSTIYPGPGQPGGALVSIVRASGFTDPVNVWTEAPPGIVAVPLPDPASGPDTWRILVHAPPELCSEFSLTVRASGGGVEQTTTVWAAPSCGTGGTP